VAGMQVWLKEHPWVVRFAQIVAVVTPLAMLISSLFRNWDELRAFNQELDIGRSALAVLVLVASMGLLPLAARKALLALGYRLEYRTVYCGYFVAQLTKYLPGGFWIVPGRMVVFARYGVSAVSSGVGIMIEVTVLSAAAIVTFLPYFFFVNVDSLPRAAWIGILPVLAAFVGLYPAIFNLGINRLLALAGYDEKTKIDLTGHDITSIFLIDVAFWLVTGFGFCLVVTGVQAESLRFWLAVGSTFSMAWVIGFLAFLTPSGLGVREGALAVLLTPLLPAPLPAVVALASRIWWTLGDLVSVGVAGLVRRRLPGKVGLAPNHGVKVKEIE
jgi:hypothetical protein